MFSMAEIWGMRQDGSNPRLHIKKYPEEKRERYLSQKELSDLGAVLKEAEEIGVDDIYAISAIRLLIFTGCRLIEIMSLKWTEVDFANSCLRLSDSKTGARVVHTGPPALDLLKNLKRQPKKPAKLLQRKLNWIYPPRSPTFASMTSATPSPPVPS